MKTEFAREYEAIPQPAMDKAAAAMAGALEMLREEHAAAKADSEEFDRNNKWVIDTHMKKTLKTMHLHDVISRLEKALLSMSVYGQGGKDD